MAAINNTEIMLKDIGMVYRTNDGRDVTALTGVTLNIEKGEFVSLVGRPDAARRHFSELLPTCLPRHRVILKYQVKVLTMRD